MKQKIELYREVLELEPGSRVFFPLAKLLIQDERSDEALDVLREGLLRRPDHLEARLLLVELLCGTDDEAGLDAEMTQLERVFSSYPAFWEEWSGRLSRRPESKDAAIAGRFFSLSLQGRPVNWADVIDQGLRAFTEGQPARPRVADMPDLSLGSQPAERVARLEESVSRMPHLSLSLSQEQPAERTPSGPQHAELATKGWGFSLVENQEAEAAPQRRAPVRHRISECPR